MKTTGILSLAAALSSLVGAALAQDVQPWGQCGGINYSGAKTCTSGYSCQVINDYYHQCAPGTAGGPSSTTNLNIPPASSTSPQPPAGTGQLIRGVQAPVYHLYLQDSKSDPLQPVLGPEASADRYIISGTIRNAENGMYLNIDGTATTSYKPLKFGTTAEFSAWGLEGDTIITTQGSTYGRQLNFLACAGTAGEYKLYLQTGNDSPGSGCTLQTIHLPCLC